MAKHDLKQAREASKPQGVLRRLAANERGNALMIAAASMIPLTAAIGAGVDMSRAYATRTRMQQACDAGVLAVRRNISGNNIDDASRKLGSQFFNVNFPPDTFGAKINSTFTTSVISATNAVSGTATATLPFTMMPVIGYNSQQIKVSCQASQDFVNTDIVLVLDNTGSMNCAPTAGTAGCTSEVSGSKMDGQRDAVMALYDSLVTAQTQLEAKGLRLRYGIVPYSTTVNVGKLLYGVNNNLNAIRPTSPYQTKSTVCIQNYYGGCTNTTVYNSTNTTHSKAWLDAWAATSDPTKGCIEERKTVNTINSSTASIPADAWDLNVDMLPSTSDANTQWAPFDSTAQQGDSGDAACPRPASALKAYTRAELLTYVNTLVGKGSTYSDIGMIWGGRLISDSGVFAASPTSFNSFPVKKYVILMTDGYIDPDKSVYSAWGVENYDHRVSADPYPGDTTDTNNHKKRFNLACGAAKSKGASIWVIGFGNGVGANLDPSLVACASSSDQAAFAADRDALILKFAAIGRAIGSLRVVG